MPTPTCCRYATRRRRRKPKLRAPPSSPSGLWAADGMQAATALAPFSDQLVTEIPMLQPHPTAVVAVIGLLPFVLAACSDAASSLSDPRTQPPLVRTEAVERSVQDRKSTRLNSSHRTISYAVFCLKKKKKKKKKKNKMHKTKKIKIQRQISIITCV